ncbi:hypothetical protein LOD99_5241 [Oopsacas minuta]|uniref:Uncharacterized protein n=1 Tax=Oopsacas minuta TaxID=111878 RepID=A0AAV7JRC5_9METZ|nr:hypothetical protein LOD99_5241 [Oopsacas minuta]
MIEEVWNRQNDRILATSSTAISENLKYIDRVQKPMSVMVWGGPAHAPKSTQDWLRARKIEFISEDEWPPSSPDLNPLDFSVWANLEASACAKPHKSLDSLKLSLQREWQKIPQYELRNVVGNFRTRLQAVISQKGGYID